MKKSAKIAVLSLVGVLALGGTATAIAFGIKASSQNGTANVDKDYIDLSFENRDVTFGDLTLNAGDPAQYRTVSVKIDKNGTIAKDFKIVYTFTVTSDVTVKIYGTDPQKGETPATPLATLDKSNGTHTQAIDINAANDVYTNYLEFSVPKEAPTIDGTLNIKLIETDKASESEGK